MDNGFGPWRGILANRNPTRNMCDRVGMQSPIDLRPSGAVCDEHHEVRSRVRNICCSFETSLCFLLINCLYHFYREEIFKFSKTR
jgi:hypothetical protein